MYYQNLIRLRESLKRRSKLSEKEVTILTNRILKGGEKQDQSKLSQLDKSAFDYIKKHEMFKEVQI